MVRSEKGKIITNEANHSFLLLNAETTDDLLIAVTFTFEILRSPHARAKVNPREETYINLSAKGEPIMTNRFE
jgi:hypothetical protein